MAEKQTTTYVVLERVEARNAAEAAENSMYHWEEREAFEARSSTDAVRSYVNRNGVTKGGVFYAVPMRSWKPITVAIETQTRMKLS